MTTGSPKARFGLLLALTLTLGAHDSHAFFNLSEVLRVGVADAARQHLAIQELSKAPSEVVRVQQQAVAVERAAAVAQAAQQIAATPDGREVAVEIVQREIARIRTEQEGYLSKATAYLRFDLALRVTVFVASLAAAVILAALSGWARAHAVALVLTLLATGGQGCDATFGVGSRAATYRRIATTLGNTTSDCTDELAVAGLEPNAEVAVKTVIQLAARCKKQERDALDSDPDYQVNAVTKPTFDTNTNG